MKYKNLIFMFIFYTLVLVLLQEYISHSNYCSYAKTVTEVCLENTSYFVCEEEKKCSITSSSEVPDDPKNLYQISGWGIKRNKSKWHPGVVAILLHSPDKVYKIKSFPTTLKDIPVPSKISSNYDDFMAGFFSKFPQDEIVPGKYTLGVLYDDNAVVWTNNTCEINMIS